MSPIPTLHSECEPRPASGSNNNNHELDLQNNTIQECTDESTNETFDSAAYTTK